MDNQNQIKDELDALYIWPNKVTGTSARPDILTPHKIAIVFLLQEYFKMAVEVYKDDPNVNAYRRSFVMLMVRLIHYPDMTYGEFYALITSPAYTLHPQQLRRFENVYDMLQSHGVQVLYDLYTHTDGLITHTSTIMPTTFVGRYLRWFVLCMDKLSFTELMDVYQQTKDYFQHGIHKLATEPASDDMSLADSSIPSATTATPLRSPPLPPSSNCSLQPHSTFTSLANASARRTAIHSASTNPRCWSFKQADLFVAQQCRLLETNEPRALPPIELQSKIDEIVYSHPLFSQAHIIGYMNNLRVRDVFGARDAFHRAFDRSAVRANAPTDTKGFQYSSLNLAIMHAHQEHYDEALVCLRECIMLAQECGDRVCLQLAHSWLCLLDLNYNPRFEFSALHLNERSVHSVSLGIQSTAGVAALTGILPAKVFQAMLKSEVLNHRNSLADLLSNSLAQKAAVFTVYGKNEIASMSSQLLLHVTRSNNSQHSDTENGEGVCHALCCCALWLALRGEYDNSTVVLMHARERFPRDPLARIWLKADAYQTSVRAMHLGLWDAAAQACSQLYMLDRTLSLLQRATLLLHRGDRAGARRIALLVLDDPKLEQYVRVRAMIMLAGCCSSPAAAINLLNEASLYARQMFLAYEDAIVDMHVADLLVRMGLCWQALRTVRRVLDTILADGGKYDQGRVQFVFVQALVGAAVDRTEAKTRFLACADVVAELLENFRSVEAVVKIKDVLIWQARMNDRFGRVEERNRCARKFRELNVERPTGLESCNRLF